MEISTEMIKELRGQSGAGIMDCRSALLSCEGNVEEALKALKEKGLLQVQKKATRATTQGLIEAYIHTNGRIGAMVEVSCETDFAARTDELKEMAHCLAMQVAAQSPRFISEEELPEGDDMEAKEACLLLQPYIKDPARTVQDIVNETIARVGENIRVSRFTRFQLGN